MKQKTKSVKHNYCEKTIKFDLISKLTITAKFYNNNKTKSLKEKVRIHLAKKLLIEIN